MHTKYTNVFNRILGIICLTVLPTMSAFATEFAWETDRLFQVPENVNAYSAMGERASLSERLTLARGVAAEADVVFDMESVIDGRVVQMSHDDPAAVLDVDSRSGAIVFHAGMNDYLDETATDNLPGAMAAAAYAEDHLRRLELYPEDERQVKVLSVGGLAVSVLNRDGTTSTHDKLRTVRFQRQLDGIPVLGPGSRIVVQLGQDGELVSLVSAWAPVALRPTAKSGQKDADTLREEAENRLREISEGAERTVVKRADVVYFDDDCGVIEPMYHLEAVRTFYGTNALGGKTNDPSMKLEVPYDFYLPILKDSRATLPNLQAIPEQPRSLNERPTPDYETSDRDDEEAELQERSDRNRPAGGGLIQPIRRHDGR